MLFESNDIFTPKKKNLLKEAIISDLSDQYYEKSLYNIHLKTDEYPKNLKNECKTLKTI